MKNERTHHLVPKGLRRKYVSSRVSREIFFIDCINDLNECAKSGISYHLIRSSVLLRMLLLGNGLKTISQNYNLNIEFEANENDLPGVPISNAKVRVINKTLEEFRTKAPSTKGLQLIYKPSKKYGIENFPEKICLIMGDNPTYSFSVRNIIEIVANKNGGAHLESNFDSSSLESFHLAEFSPYSMTDGNFFLEKIREVILILREAVHPLCQQILAHLNTYDKSISQAEVKQVFRVITKKEFEKLKGSKQI